MNAASRATSTRRATRWPPHRLLALTCVRAAEAHLDRIASMTGDDAEPADVDAADVLDSAADLLERWRP